MLSRWSIVTSRSSRGRDRRRLSCCFLVIAELDSKFMVVVC